MSVQLTTSPVDLTRNLNAIQTKNVGDSQWFVLHGEDLALARRPVRGNCLYRIWLCISRVLERIVFWATGRPPLLEQRFISLFTQIEQHLGALMQTQNQAGLALFLNTYTTAINEIFRCATRMQQAGKISERTLNNLRSHERIQNYIITNINERLTVRVGAREYHPYGRIVEFRATNKLPDSTISFRAPEHEINQKLSKRKFVFGSNATTAWNIFQSTDETMRFCADVTVKRDLEVDGNSYAVFVGGEKIRKVRMEESKTEDRGFASRIFRFHNQSRQNMRVSIPELMKPGGVIVPSGQTVDVPVKSNCGWVTATAIYTLEQQFTFGCKLARYEVAVNELGGLTSQIVPFRTEGDIQEQMHTVDEGHPLTVGCPVPTAGALANLQVLNGRRPYRTALIIPSDTAALRADYAMLCVKAGVEPSTRASLQVRSSVQRIEPIIPTRA
ncbi:MAG: hypothetical protein ACHQT8_04320 [Chlamydiales bacterium]